MRIVAKNEAARLHTQVAPQEDTQHTSRSDEPLPIALKE